MDKDLIIDTIVNRSDRVDIVCKLLDVISKGSYSDGKQFIDKISKISSNIVESLQRSSLEYLEAANWAVTQQAFESSYKSARFCTMLPVCKVCFPNGNADHCSEAQRKYFNEFTSLLMDKTIFNIKKDGTWLDSYNYRDYVNLVLSNLKKGDEH